MTRVVRFIRRVLPFGVLATALCVVAPARAELADETDAMISGLFKDKGKKKKSKAKKRGSRAKKKGRRGAARRGRRSAKNKRAASRDAPPPEEQETQEAAPAIRKVVVATFNEPPGSRVRSAVLDVLTRHDELQILSFDDLEIEAKRLGVGLNSPDGRTAIALEQSVFAWVDADVSEDFAAEIRVTDALNQELSTLRLSGTSSHLLASAIRTGLWQRVGPVLSEKARLESLLEVERKLAAAKLKAQADELKRQRKLGLDRDIKRKQLLAAHRGQASNKMRDWKQEAKRQEKLVRDKRLAEARERKQKEEELRRKLLAQKREAEMERRRQQQAAARAAQQGAWPRPQPGQQQARPGYPQPAYRQPARGTAGRYPTTARPGYGTAPAQPARPGTYPSTTRPAYGTTPARPGYPSGQTRAPATAPAPAARPGAGTSVWQQPGTGQPPPKQGATPGQAPKPGTAATTSPWGPPPAAAKK